jgi:transposase-like protein
MAGLNAAKKVIPFGFCLLVDETKDSFYKVLRSFFKIMEATPEAIITDDSQVIKAALVKLTRDREFEGAHLLDNFVDLMRVRTAQKFEKMRL